jgi:hypothetical protein
VISRIEVRRVVGLALLGTSIAADFVNDGALQFKRRHAGKRAG